MEINKQRIAELVGKVQNGDNSAFDELYRLTSERAYFVALEFTKNNQDAEDILQESYIKALSKIKELDKPESFSSWLNQIVANKSKDFLKKKKPMLFEAEENEVFEVIPDEDTEFSPEENLDQTELQKTVMEVLDELSEEKRACVLMMYFEELSVGKIAETLEIPEGTVKTRLFSARKDLKEKFAKRGITSTFSVAPIGVVIWAMRRASETVQKSFAASPAPAKVLAGIAVAGTGTAASVATAGTAAATTAAVTAGAVTATGAAATGTGIAAKIAALTVAQKVIAGVSVAAVVAGSTAGVVTVVNNDDKKDGISTTAYTEEYTTAPSFETTLAIQAMGTVEFSETMDLSAVESLDITSSSSKQSTTNRQETSGEKTTKPTKTTTKSATQTTTKKSTTTKATTTKKQTATKKETTTKKVTTTKATTTKKQTATEKETTTKKVTTTKATTTEKQTTTTTKPTTTKAATTTTTKATTAAPATIVIKVLDLDNTVVDTLYFYDIAAGTEMSNSYLWDLVEAEGYSVSGVFGSDKGGTAESGKTYTFEAEL